MVNTQQFLSLYKSLLPFWQNSLALFHKKWNIVYAMETIEPHDILGRKEAGKVQPKYNARFEKYNARYHTINVKDGPQS